MEKAKLVQTKTFWLGIGCLVGGISCFVAGGCNQDVAIYLITFGLGLIFGRDAIKKLQNRR